jgi:hypothetical protein
MTPVHTVELADRNDGRAPSCGHLIEALPAVHETSALLLARHKPSDPPLANAPSPTPTGEQHHLPFTAETPPAPKAHSNLFADADCYRYVTWLA